MKQAKNEHPVPEATEVPEVRANCWPCDRMVCFFRNGEHNCCITDIFFFILLDDFRWKQVHTDHVVVYSGLLPSVQKGVFPK